MVVEVVEPRVSNRISGRISCQPWICVGGTNHACRTLVETNTKSIDIAKGFTTTKEKVECHTCNRTANALGAVQQNICAEGC
jgi:hypothetical protein